MDSHFSVLSYWHIDSEASGLRFFPLGSKRKGFFMDLRVLYRFVKSDQCSVQEEIHQLTAASIVQRAVQPDEMCVLSNERAWPVCFCSPKTAAFNYWSVLRGHVATFTVNCRQAVWEIQDFSNQEVSQCFKDRKQHFIAKQPYTSVNETRSCLNVLGWLRSCRCLAQVHSCGTL